MSGEDLRLAAINGDHEILKEYILQRCNPCSVDEYGLTPLHYAVWNAHVECVKLLVCNTRGVDKYGRRASSLDLTSSMGFTALHLAALDCPKQRAYEVATLLFIGGARPTAISGDKRTPKQIAEDVRNEEFLAAYEDFKRARDDTEIYNRLSELRNDLNLNYCFQTNMKTRGVVEPFEAKFTLPDFLFMDTARTGNIPDELTIHEHQIRPLAKTGFNHMQGLESISCLAFSKDQALINKHRRERLLEHAEKDFRPAHVPNT